MDVAEGAVTRQDDLAVGTKMDAMDTVGVSRVDRVSAVFPGSPRYVRAVRLLVTSSAIGFDVEQLDDLRIVVDELWSAALEVSTGPIRLDVDISAGHCRFSGSAPWTGGTAELDPMRSAIVETLAHHHHFELRGEQVDFGFVFPAERVDD